MVKSVATIAITGAGGFLGSSLVRHFSEKGWQVVGLVRDPSKYPTTELVSYQAYDLSRPVANDLLKNVDYLIHAAYVKQAAKTADAFDLNVTAAKDLLQVSRSNKLKRNIFISSMSAHEGAISVYGRQKLAIEALFNTRTDISLRPGLIVGDGGIVRNMAQFMKTKHLVPLIGGGQQPLQIVSVSDLTRVIDRVLSTNVRGVLTIATPQVYSYKEFYKILSNHLNVTVIFLPVPFFVLLTIFRTAKLLRLPLDIGEDNLLGLKKLTAADSKPDLETIGITLNDLEDSLQAEFPAAS